MYIYLRSKLKKDKRSIANSSKFAPIVATVGKENIPIEFIIRTQYEIDIQL